MINYPQLKDLIIIPTLKDLVLLSDNAVELMLFTCAVESHAGTYLKQIGGPALGIYQMEPETYHEMWLNYIKNNSNLLQMLFSNFNLTYIPPEERLIYDLRYATAMTRIFYKRIQEELPPANDINKIWEYYKKYYNTIKGAAEKESSINRYLQFVKV